MFPFFWHVEDERHIKSTIIRPAFTAWHSGTVVAVVKDNCVLCQTGLGNLLEVGPDPGIHHGYAVIILRPVLAHLRGIRMISGDTGLLGVMDHIGLRNVVTNLALVTDGVIKNGEERLILFTILPVSLPATLMPYLSFR